MNSTRPATDPIGHRSRRSFLSAALLCGGWAPRLLAQGAEPSQEPEKDEERQDRESVEKRALEAGLGPFRAKRTKHFQVFGNVGSQLQSTISGDCEDVAADFASHFAAKGFKFALPDRRMTVVALADERAYGRFLGEKVVSLASGGRYDLRTNRLVVFDYRPAQFQVSARVSWLNLTTLAHEVTHQLCYNSGVLDRAGDIPRCIVEGLATYAEERPPNARNAMGRLNNNRLDDLANLQRQVAWIPVRSLFETDNALFGKLGGGKLLLAYAQSWLLVYYWMTQPSRTAAFRAYLDAIRPRRNGERRVEDAEKHLGKLDQLDHELKRFSVLLLKSR